MTRCQLFKEEGYLKTYRRLKTEIVPQRHSAWWTAFCSPHSQVKHLFDLYLEAKNELEAYEEELKILAF